MVTTLGARTWPEADALFHADRRWLGSDDAYSVPLGADRTLWLFGDTLVQPTGAGDRHTALFLYNTVAVQTGLDPRTATIEFVWGDGDSTLFASPREDTWLWPHDAVVVDGRLLLCFFEVVSTRQGPIVPEAGALEFAVVGTVALLVDDPDAHPRDWRPTPVTLPALVPDLQLGTALQVVDDHLLSWCEIDKRLLLCRWRVADAARGDLSDAQWSRGAGTWTRDIADAAVIADDVPTELTVHPHDGEWLMTEIGPGADGRSHLRMRRAPQPWGPWGEPQPFWAPQEQHLEGGFVYAGKAHPELTTPAGMLAVTYASNKTTLQAALDDTSVYYPRFVLVDLP
jgi:hypothetical protein